MTAAAGAPGKAHAPGKYDYRVQLFRNAAEVFFRVRYLTADEARDRKRVEAALADILDFALHQLRRDNRP